MIFIILLCFKCIIFAHHATLPVLISFLDFFRTSNDVSNDSKYHIIFFSSRSTLTRDNIDSFCNSNGITYTYIDSGEHYAYGKIQKYIAANKDKYSSYHLYVDDVRCYLERLLFKYNGITNDKYSITLCSDGTLTYEYYIKFNLTELKVWDDLNEKYNMIYNSDDYSDVLDQYYTREVNPELLWIAATKSNVNLIVSNPDYLPYTFDNSISQKYKLNINSVSIANLYKSLDEKTKSKFLNLFGYNLDEDKKIFYRKTLLIIGSSNDYEISSSCSDFRILIKSLVSFYPDYNFVYKPHPAYVSRLGKKKPILDKYKIKVYSKTSLPGEIIIWNFPDLIYTGGFISTLMLSSSKDKIKFLFYQDKTYEPFNYLNQTVDFFENAIYVYKTTFLASELE